MDLIKRFVIDEFVARRLCVTVMVRIEIKETCFNTTRWEACCRSICGCEADLLAFGTRRICEVVLCE